MKISPRNAVACGLLALPLLCGSGLAMAEPNVGFAAPGQAAANAVAALAGSTPAGAIADPSPAGDWAGAVELPGTKLEIQVRLADTSDALTGTVSIPAQNAKDLALEKVGREGATVRFSIRGVPGDPTFRGSLSPDGGTITGEFTQAGQTFPFSLSRRASVDASATLDGFDAWMNKALADWEVPGASVAIVFDGKTVLSKGYGVRDLETNQPATEHTLFAIGSSTKAFTTFVMGLLADEGKLDWNAPVVTSMPRFKLADAEAGRAITPLDLVTHRSGLPRHDAVWYNSSATRGELVERLAFLPPNKALRQTWQYNNLMFVTAGVLTEHITGRTWEADVKSRILEPLGMTRTNFAVTDSQRDVDFSFPYDKRETDGRKRIQRIPFRDLSTVGPAGSINSSASDMSNWVLVHLSGKNAAGERIVSDATLRTLHAPQMTMPSDSTQPEVITLGYAPGWFVDVYRGHTRIHHGGNIDGFSALVFFFPRVGLGGVILTNRNSSPLPGIAAKEIADRFLKLDRKDWSAESLAQRSIAEAAAKEAKAKKNLARVTGTKPSHDLASYAGEYEHPGYGIATITFEGTALTGSYNGLTAGLSHWHYDTFAFGKSLDASLEDSQLLFATDFSGEIESFKITLEPSVPPITFTRRPDRQLSDPAYLQRFVGSYKLTAHLITISLRGNTLIASIPGQPDYELIPTRDNSFTLKGLSGFRMRFTLDAAGKPTSLASIQPNGVFEAKRE